MSDMRTIDLMSNDALNMARKRASISKLMKVIEFLLQQTDEELITTMGHLREDYMGMNTIQDTIRWFDCCINELGRFYNNDDNRPINRRPINWYLVIIIIILMVGTLIGLLRYFEIF